MAILSSSFLLCKLLPTAISHLGPIASLQPKVCQYVQYCKCGMSVNSVTLVSVLQYVYMFSTYNYFNEIICL